MSLSKLSAYSALLFVLTAAAVWTGPTVMAVDTGRSWRIAAGPAPAVDHQSTWHC